MLKKCAQCGRKVPKETMSVSLEEERICPICEELEEIEWKLEKVRKLVRKVIKVDAEKATQIERALHQVNNLLHDYFNC